MQQPLNRVGSYGAVAEAIVAGVGIGLLPDNIAAPLIRKGELVKLPFTLQRQPYPVMLIRHKSKTLSEPMQLFRQHFLNHDFRRL